MSDLQLLPHEAKWLQELHSGAVIIHNRKGQYYDSDGNKLDLLKIITWMVHIENEVKDLRDGGA